MPPPIKITREAAAFYQGLSHAAGLLGATVKKVDNGMLLY
jgi:hypothetical protein